MPYRTFHEWRDNGYHVVAGGKSVKRNKAGVCLFSRKQVEKDREIPIDMQIEMLCINEADLYLSNNCFNLTPLVQVK